LAAPRQGDGGSIPTKKTLPAFTTDAAARDFVDTANFSDYNPSGGRAAQLRLAAESVCASLRVPKPLLDTLKECAELRGTPYTHFIRRLIEREISQTRKPFPPG